jgi:cysteinyl-tRNA synthetase
VGFPGWHIECSAMSLANLPDQLDIHCGGIDHINIHHTNEIAQSEAATGQKFFNYWLHCAFLNIEGGKKMAKSADNFLTLDNALTNKHITPLAYRFAALQVHYRKPMEYSEESLKHAESALLNLYSQIAWLGEEVDKNPGKVIPEYQAKFLAAINDDLNMPKALAVMFSVFDSDSSAADQLKTILDFDRVLGLELNDWLKEIPEDILDLVQKIDSARLVKDYAQSDELRKKIEAQGYRIEYTAAGTKVYKNVF